MTARHTYETGVLIVGGGPVGLALALDLAHRGVDFLLVEAGGGTVFPANASSIGPRAMELFRRWGVADQIRGAGWPGDHPLDVAWVTAVGGHELHRLDFGTADTRPLPEHTPEPDAICLQQWLQPLLAQRLGAHPEGPVLFHHRLREFTQYADRVTAVVVDDSHGTQLTVHARFLAGCDGASSAVRKACRIEVPARHPTRVLRNILFHAPELHARLSPRTALVYFLTMSRTLRYPMRAMDGRGVFRLTAAAEDAEPEAVVRQALAFYTPVRVLADTVWHLTHRVAERYRHGRVLLVGDAAHTLSPSGGFGMSTGICDAADLGWKLAAELAGWAGPGLLDSYEAERRPVAVSSLEEANRNLNRTTDRQLSSALRHDTPEGERARAELSLALRHSDAHREFDAPEVHFAYRYDSPVIVPDPAPEPGTGPEPGTATPPPWSATTEPGRRAPHAWLGPGRSTLDLFGDGFVLMAQGTDERLDGCVRAFADRGVPLRIERPGNGATGAGGTAGAAGKAPDVARGVAAEVALRYERRFVLVRPDGHVAWRGDTLPHAPHRLVDTVRGAMPAAARGAVS